MTKIATPDGAQCINRSKQENKRIAFEQYLAKRSLQRHRFWFKIHSPTIFVTEYDGNANHLSFGRYSEITTVESLVKRTKTNPTVIKLRSNWGEKNERYDTWDMFVEHNLIIKLSGL